MLHSWADNSAYLRRDEKTPCNLKHAMALHLARSHPAREKLAVVRCLYHGSRFPGRDLDLDMLLRLLFGMNAAYGTGLIQQLTSATAELPGHLIATHPKMPLHSHSHRATLYTST